MVAGIDDNKCCGEEKSFLVELAKFQEQTSGAGGPVDATQVAYTNSGYPTLDTVAKALDKLLYVALSSSGFSNTVGTVDIGRTITDVTLNWSYNKSVTSQSINQGIGSLAIGLRTLALSGLSLTTDTTYTLTASDGTTTVTPSTSVLFRNRRFWGVSADAVPDETTLTGLSNELSASRVQTRTLNGGGNYLYFAWPSSFGTPSFVVDGFASTAWEKTTISHTNAYGYTVNYDIYRSTYPQSGSGIVVAVS